MNTIRGIALFLITLCSFVFISYFAFAAHSFTNLPTDQNLLFSAFSGDLPGVEAALASGANIDVQDPSSGQTPLMGAVLRGHLDVVRYLLEQRADPLIPEKDGYTPVHGAGFQGRAEIMKVLKEKHGLDVLVRHRDEYTPFHRACWGREDRHTEMVKYMLEQGVDMNLVGGTPPRTCKEMTPNKKTKRLLKEWELKQQQSSKTEL